MIPKILQPYDLTLSDNGNKLIYTYDTVSDSTGITAFLQNIHNAGLTLKDLQIKKSSLEDIFVDLVKNDQSLADQIQDNQAQKNKIKV